MATDIKDIAERIEVLRDRFVGWGLLVGFVSFIAAVWTTAPTLEIDLPVPAGTKVSLNVGYVLALGMPLLALAYAWSMAPLLAVRRYQEAVAREVSAGNIRISDFEMLRMIGPQAERGTMSRFGRAAYAMSFSTRVLVLFIVPILGQLWIAEEYFFALKYFDKKTVVTQRLSVLAQGSPAAKPEAWNTEKWNIAPRDVPRLVEYLFAEKPSRGSVQAEYYFVESGPLESPCVRSWVHDELSTNAPSEQSMKGLAERLAKEPDAAMRCVFTSFPKFTFWLNSWVNLLSLLAVICLSMVGLEVYAGKYFRRSLPPRDGLQNH